MPLSDCTHWIFDMDGTLTLAAHDFDAIRSELGITNGKPILEAIDEMPKEQALAAMQQLDDIEMKIAGAAKPQMGATELLSHLHEQNHTLGILTRNGCEIAIETLKAAGLYEFFPNDCILGRESCAPKPDPAGIKLHLSRWNAEAQSTVMVGDYKFDLEAGFNAGVHTVHLDVGNGEQWPEFTTLLVNTLHDLQQLATA